MQWSDEGIVLGARRHGETGAILELLTRAHGRHLGLVHGGRSRRLAAVLQPGNTVRATWRARLDEHLGTYAVEGVALRAARFVSATLALYGIGTAAAHLRLLPERDPHPALYEATEVLLEHLDEGAIAPALFVRFELALLSELGFGLDLTRCAVTGEPHDLVYVSPKSGRAIGGEAGRAYADKLLALPPFLRGGTLAERPGPAELRAGFALTEHFLRLRVFEPRGLPVPPERARFVARATREAG